MTARATRPESSPARATDREGLHHRISDLYTEAVAGVLPSKIEQTTRKWFQGRAEGLDPDEGLEAAATAMVLAMDLEIFTPSHSGSTAIDRLARRPSVSADDKAALAALSKARFTPFIIERMIGEGRYEAEDLALQTKFALVDGAYPTEALGMAMTAWTVALDDESRITVGPVLPLDDAGLAVAIDFIRPGRGIPHGHRCAAAVYRHVVRHGGPKIPGLNALDETADLEDLSDYRQSPFEALAVDLLITKRWQTPPRDVLDEVRGLSSVDGILECLVRAATDVTIATGEARQVFRRFAEVMIEVLHRRALAGSGADRAPLDRLAEIIDQEIRTNDYPRAAREIFDDIRRALSATAPRPETQDLTRVLERIRALRAKTVDQGCTEEEALAAADKVAELLDRYGLSLGETDLRHQACLGVGIESNRKRMGPLDDCVPAIAQFCDCRAWTERTPTGTIRSMFFGLPADVEAAQYLFERVATALETETAAFRKGEIYQGLAGGGRQRATSSFQLGLSRGIGRKLAARKEERAAKTVQATGRDLVPVKASVVEDELAKLGLHFSYKESSRNRMVLRDAFEAGQVASGRFEIQSEIEGA